MYDHSRVLYIERHGQNKVIVKQEVRVGTTLFTLKTTKVPIYHKITNMYTV